MHLPSMFKIIKNNIVFFTPIHCPVLFELDVVVLLKYCNNQVVVAKIWIGWSRKFMGHLDIKIIWTVVPISITEPRTSGQTFETSNIFAPNIFQNVRASWQIIHVESWLSYTKGEWNIFQKYFMQISSRLTGTAHWWSLFEIIWMIRDYN